MELTKERLEQLRGKQIRFFRPDQIRTEEIDGEKFIRAYPIVFDQPCQPFRGWDDYREEIGREALEGITFRDCRVLINHNPDLVMGREGINARMQVEDSGVFVESKVHAGIQYQKDYYNAIKAGLIDGGSFALTVPEDGIEYIADRDVYRITKISDLWEVSFVTFPAYEQTVAIAREQQKAVVGPEPAPVATPETDTRETNEAEPPADMGPEPGQETRQEEQANEPEPTPVDAQERAKVLAALELAIGGKPNNA